MNRYPDPWHPSVRAQISFTSSYWHAGPMGKSPKMGFSSTLNHFRDMIAKAVDLTEWSILGSNKLKYRRVTPPLKVVKFQKSKKSVRKGPI